MKIIRSKAFTADRAWGALDIAHMNGITTRLHWTDQPYKWHVNDGEEVFVVLDGQVQMRYRERARRSTLCSKLAISSTPPSGLSTLPIRRARRGFW